VDLVPAEFGHDLLRLAVGALVEPEGAGAQRLVLLESNCAKLSRWLEMEMPRRASASILRVSCFSAVVAAPVQSEASCSNQPGLGLESGTAARPSATARPFRSKAMAFVEWWMNRCR
jgi:hypothetical protein